MLYHLLWPLYDRTGFILFNLFGYVTFRAAGGMATALFISLALVVLGWMVGDAADMDPGAEAHVVAQHPVGEHRRVQLRIHAGVVVGFDVLRVLRRQREADPGGGAAVSEVVSSLQRRRRLGTEGRRDAIDPERTRRGVSAAMRDHDPETSTRGHGHDSQRRQLQHLVHADRGGPGQPRRPLRVRCLPEGRGR